MPVRSVSFATLFVTTMFVASGCRTADRVTYTENADTDAQAEADSLSVEGVGANSNGDRRAHVELAYPSGDRRTSVILIEKFAPREVRRSTQFQYDIVVTNLTARAVDGVRLSERLGEGFLFASSSPIDPVIDGTDAEWDIGTIEPHGSLTISVHGSANDGDIISPCTSVVYNAGACLVTDIVDPHLSLEIFAPPSTLRCDEMPVRFVVTNTGTGSIRNTAVHMPLPEGWRTSEGESSEVSFRVDRLGATQSREFVVNVEPDQLGAFELSATAAADGDFNAAAKAGTTTVIAPQLTIKVEAARQAFVGRPASVRIEVVNTGEVTVQEAVVELQIPANAAFVRTDHDGKSASNAVRWEIGDLPVDSSRELRASIASATTAVLDLEATATGHCVEARSETVRSEVVGTPALLLEVADLADPVEVGEDVTYRVSVTNEGSADGTNVVVECELDDGLSVISSSGVTAAEAQSNTVRFAPVPTLAPQQSVSWDLVLRAAKEGDTRFHARMTSDQLTRPVEESEATLFFK